MKIAAIEVGHYKIPLPKVLSDSTHGVHDLPVHLMAAVHNKSLLEAHGFGLEGFIADPMVITEGYASAPDRPGHGVEFDWKGITALAVE